MLVLGAWEPVTRYASAFAVVAVVAGPWSFDDNARDSEFPALTSALVRSSMVHDLGTRESLENITLWTAPFPNNYRGFN